MVVLIWIVFLVVGKECIKVYTLFEVLNSFQASQVLQELEVPVHIEAGSNESVPVDAL